MRLKKSLADQDTLTECNVMRFIFNIIPLGHHTALIGVAVIGYH